MPSPPTQESTKLQRVALITGAARRIGRDIALSLAEDGWAVALHYRRSGDEAEALAGDIRGRGGAAAAVGADLSDTHAVRRLFAECETALGAPSCLVNNASEFVLDSIETMDEKTWSTHQDINLKAPLFLAQALHKSLAPDQTGNIINIIDQRVWNLKPDFFSYTISKAGLWTATRTLAQALAPRIRVNAIGPGPMFKSVYQSEGEFAAEQASTLLRHGPAISEISGAVRFILATQSLTGQMIAVDAGQHLV